MMLMNPLKCKNKELKASNKKTHNLTTTLVKHTIGDSIHACNVKGSAVSGDW